MKSAPSCDAPSKLKLKHQSKTMETTLIEEFRKGLTEIKDGITKTDKDVAGLNTGVAKLQNENERLQAEFNKVRSATATRARTGGAWGMVSDDCAAYYGAIFIQQCAK